MRNQLKNQLVYNGVNMESSTERYSLRSKVMSVLYECKKRGYVLPRVEVRILESVDACAYAYLGKNIIHINANYMTKQYASLFESIILHEIVHACFGVGEVVGCQLMHCSKFWSNRPSSELSWQLFDTYYNYWK